MPLARAGRPRDSARVSQPQPEREEYEDWRLLQEALEERDREWWAEADDESDEL